VRINPYELHINDPEYYDTIYCGPSKRREKWAWSAKMFGNSTGMFSTVPHELHRIRRAALNPYFSKRSVMQLEPVISSRIESLCNRFREFRKSHQPVNLGVAYSAMTTDIITEYCFARSYGFLAKPDFAPEWLETLMAAAEASHLIKQFGWMYAVMQALPDWFVERTSPAIMGLIHFQRNLEEQVQGIIDGKNDSHKTADHPTIFHELLDSDLSPEERNFARLVAEGQAVVAGGTITTANYLKVTSFHLLANPPVLQKLKAELATAMPNYGMLPRLAQLESLPYLSAVVLEGFRMSYGVTCRLPRVSPDEPLLFHEWVIPAGTPVSMTSVFMHDNPALFPEPTVFRPERWLEENAKERLSRYLVNFSKGTRMCLGMNLAYAEIYLTLAAVFRRFDLELFETTREDVDIVHDFLHPSARLDSKGVRVLVK